MDWDSCRNINPIGQSEKYGSVVRARTVYVECFATAQQQEYASSIDPNDRNWLYSSHFFACRLARGSIITTRQSYGRLAK